MSSISTQIQDVQSSTRVNIRSREPRLFLSMRGPNYRAKNSKHPFLLSKPFFSIAISIIITLFLFGSANAETLRA